MSNAQMAPLTEHALLLLRAVFSRHPEVEAVTLFGSRAKGSHAECSDVDLALIGDVDELQAESIAGELDELPLPYRFDVQAVHRIQHAALRGHIERVGIQIYSA